MKPERLEPQEIAALLCRWPGDTGDLALELRDLVLDTAPKLAEKIAFNSLCYYKPGVPYGVIGGNVCLIGARDECLHLAFIHGAFLPDPGGFLKGVGKAKRHIELRAPEEIHRRAFQAIIRAAIAYDPAAA